MTKYAGLFKTGARQGGAETDNESTDERTSPDEESYTLLFVDDEENVLNALRRVFMDENYRIFTSPSAAAALAVMEKEKVHLVISDHRMPGMTGAELLKEIKSSRPDVIRIMLTGHADVQSIMGAVNEGAVYKFITKPWNDEDLRLSVSLALQQYTLLQENRKLRDITKKQEQKIKNYSSLFDEQRGVMGSILIKTGLITQESLDRAHRERQGDEFPAETLVRLGLVSDQAIARAFRNDLHIESLDLRETLLSPPVVRFLPRELCEKNRLVPVKLDGRQLTLAMADPSDIYKRDNIAFMTGLKVEPLLARAPDILAQLRKVYGDQNDIAAADDLNDIEPLDEIDIVIEEDDHEVSVQELIGSSGVPPIIRIVNAVISEALRYKASDIHIEPKIKSTVIRYRIDGLLHSKIRIPAEVHTAVISRIKILGKLDIAERRKPQDGRITVKLGTRVVDVRVSTMPTINGEKVVMRILDKNAAIRTLDELGVRHDELRRLRAVTKKPQGMFVSTGPTGSGKTTMLYSVMNEMLQSTKNFETIEDPVEYFLEEANQVHILDKNGISFASVLRATMRQDPDVILVGEIRDHETADVAFKAALTGHMVLTTLHTNNTVASITRLMDMGVKPYLIASAIEGILAQRLVRKICHFCKIEEDPDQAVLDLLKLTPRMMGGRVFRGKGCERCGQSGYLGRTGVFELFVMNDDFRHVITTSYKESDLMAMARAGGMKTLLDDGSEKVRLGETTLEELLRVIGPQTKPERTCEGCGKVVDSRFAFCPYCSMAKSNFCGKCMIVLEEDWSVCPSCGAPKGGVR